MDYNIKKANRLPREIWAAAVSLKGLWPVDTIERRMKDILGRMENVFPFEPDVIVIPETIQSSWVNEIRSLDEIAEDEKTPGPITGMLAEVAKKQHCYITAPVITKSNGHFYNSSILLDREGKIAGVFHKVRPTSTEIIPDTYYKGGGVMPGSLRPPVFKTDFGMVGMQICADASWEDNWKSLKSDGAEVVLFPSQGPFSNTLRNHAWVNHYYIVGATGEDSQIIDMTGDIIEADGEFARWVCAPLNLEKVFLHIWPQTLKFNDIRKKYGTRIRLKVYHLENWATLESMDPDIKVKDILREFEIPTYDEQLQQSTEIQNKRRLA
ncbi:MAG TPA: carbon-nitrogen hydrolase family protein [Chryseosolibacter sp.]|nr:carbon-nitrogen hydrolase family protein [Chryseosolibacter sp.]